MHPTEIMEYGLATILFFVILLASLFIRKSRRKWIYIAAGLYVLLSIGFFIYRPTYIDSQIARKAVTLNQYLEQKYPDETWTFWTVPHREDSYVSRNPYIIEVTFANEPDVHYGFLVKRDSIELRSYWSERDSIGELRHWEPIQK